MFDPVPPANHSALSLERRLRSFEGHLRRAQGETRKLERRLAALREDRAHLRRLNPSPADWRADVVGAATLLADDASRVRRALGHAGAAAQRTHGWFPGQWARLERRLTTAELVRRRLVLVQAAARRAAVSSRPRRPGPRPAPGRRERRRRPNAPKRPWRHWTHDAAQAALREYTVAHGRPPTAHALKGSGLPSWGTLYHLGLRLDGSDRSE